MALELAYLSVVFALLSAAISLGASPARKGLFRFGAFGLLALSGLSAVGAGILALTANQPFSTQFVLGLPWLHWHLRLDALSGFFSIILGTLVFSVSLYGPSYVRSFERAGQSLPPLGFFTGLFIAAMQLVLLADDAFMFMLVWELMSVSSYFLVAYQHEHAANRHAAFLYLLMAHVGALAILFAFGVLAAFATDFSFEALRAAALSPAWATIAFALAVVGFGMKAGMVPLHVWLPEAHPAAPSHISALLSGVMIKLGIYGIVRLTYDLIGQVQWEWGLALLVLGALSAVLGVLYALAQHDLKRLLAYHSVENIGIILMGLGLSLIFLGTGHSGLGALGLVAALYHTLNHAIFKCLLFLGAGAVLHRTHERDLDRMGGLIQRMPVTAFLFLIGCISISALPPFNGFVSEWLTFQVALQAPALTSGVLRAFVPVTAAMLALAAALAAACFVKAYGVAFLGRARTRQVGHAREVTSGMLAGMGLLAALCLLLGVFPTTTISVIETIPQQLLGLGLPSATAHGWLWLTPVSAEGASYSAPLVLAAIVLVFGIGWLLLHRRARARRGYPWDCGYGALSNRMQYTATAFAQPIRRIFAPVWQIREEIQIARDPRAPALVREVRHHLHVLDWSWTQAYEPFGRLVLLAARRIGVIQTGNIRTYLLYSFLTLLLLLLVVS